VGFKAVKDSEPSLSSNFYFSLYHFLPCHSHSLSQETKDTQKKDSIPDAKQIT
jgi:hypothetical protein